MQGSINIIRISMSARVPVGYQMTVTKSHCQHLLPVLFELLRHCHWPCQETVKLLYNITYSCPEKLYYLYHFYIMIFNVKCVHTSIMAHLSCNIIFMFFINKGFRTIVFIFIVIPTMFRPICPPAFSRCLSKSGTHTELPTASFIESTGGHLFWFR